MNRANSQILTVAQMRAAEEAVISAGTSVNALMLTAGRGAADWVWQIGWPHPVTVLCGPGNNGGDGYVIAETLRVRGLDVAVVAPLEPKTAAARNARAAYGGPVLDTGDSCSGGVLVDCLFGSGLIRPLSDALYAVLTRLAATHAIRVAVDLPSGVEADSGQPLNAGLPDYALTIALGAWKYAHWLMPAAARMGARKLVCIGVDDVSGAAQLLRRPKLCVPPHDAHKYTRGLAIVIAGAMPGAALLACRAAMYGGAGYVKLAAESPPGGTPIGLVVQAGAAADQRASALLAGPGLGRGGPARSSLIQALARDIPTVLDADALMLLQPDMLAAHTAPIIAAPHGGELAALLNSFGIACEGRLAAVRALAGKSGMTIIAKGPDTVIVSPDGQTAIAAPAPSWLSTAGTGDVLAGLAVSRLASNPSPFSAACEAVWLHGQAARNSGAAFSAEQLADSIPSALTACL